MHYSNEYLPHVGVFVARCDMSSHADTNAWTVIVLGEHNSTRSVPQTGATFNVTVRKVAAGLGSNAYAEGESSVKPVCVNESASQSHLTRDSRRGDSAKAAARKKEIRT